MSELSSPSGSVPIQSPAVALRSPRWLLVLLLGSLAGMGPLAIDMYLPSFPSIAKDFGTSVASVERTLAAYFVGLAMGQLFYGPAADRFGRKRPLYVGLILFAVASFGCAMTHSVPSLAILRFLQALGGCAEMVIARAVVRDLFDEREGARMFGSLMLVMGLAPILAPMLGGWLVLHYSWRVIFWILVAFALLCTVMVATVLRETLPPERRNKYSVGETLSIYVSLLSHRAFMMHTLTVSLMCAGLFAYVGGSPFVLIELFHVAPNHFGFFFGANAFSLIASSQINGAIIHRVDPRTILRVALTVALVSGSLMLTAAVANLGFVPLLVPLFCFMGTMGFIFPTTTALAMAPHGRIAGNASAVFGCIQFLVSGLGGMGVSLLHNGTAIPMAGLMTAAAATALTCNLLAPRTAVPDEIPTELPLD